MYFLVYFIFCVKHYYRKNIYVYQPDTLKKRHLVFLSSRGTVKFKIIGETQTPILANFTNPS